MHHSIEESYVFPKLAKRMPSFKRHMSRKLADGSTDGPELLNQHDLIHPGLERMEAYLEGCRNGEQELRLKELKAIMDEFGNILWTHMKEEVDELTAENMRKYWKIEEMDQLRF
ncbi:hypothetical protein P152DRAFT_456414 [Eremomyces bilateralis CBS 781.70]|uniref:Hemerythrin-like domain-containing protein n=1 Tax=Eremomyces bilateralis CBS 781.70 TaxID=1392243 RepID=A0A6G1G859_9PEZI|nr:uncharacterized protein P152DRAFT_456414 [Eremomyces bilateralis CBS 781.70]KAF1814182.1 hypothetical protein P152DRAFT_456414 [Eremomyces bilateralis CBS 781.70]